MSSDSAQQHAQSPARKVLVAYARTLPKDTEIWIQGVIVGVSPSEIVLDDGSGIARVQYKQKRGNSFDEGSLKLDGYVMAVGKMSIRLKAYRMGMLAHTIRDLSENSPFLETSWNLEVVDAFLYQQEQDEQLQVGTSSAKRINKK